jgi:hypothetical protein
MRMNSWFIATCAILISALSICIWDFIKDNHMYQYVVQSNTIEVCEQYLSIPRTEIIQKNYKKEVRQLKNHIEWQLKKEKEKEKEELVWHIADSTKNYTAYIEQYPKGHYCDSAKILVEKEKRKIEEQIEKQKREIEERIRQEKEIEEAKKWDTEYKAWNEAVNRNTSVAYKKYLELYPYGDNVAQAKKKVIDKEVDNIFGSEHGTLPPMNKTSSYGTGSHSTISVYNNTPYTLTLRYSGNESKIINIRSHNRLSITLLNGNYRIAASVNASNVRNFAGRENLTGDDYEVEYYISTSYY